jgi:Tfp pilus assembly protein PilF
MDRIEKLKELLRTSPADQFMQHALALEMIKAGDELSARRLFEGLLTQDPGYVGSYYHLAKLLERTGDKEAARLWYMRGIASAKQAGDMHALQELEAAYEELIN